MTLYNVIKFHKKKYLILSVNIILPAPNSKSNYSLLKGGGLA